MSEAEMEKEKNRAYGRGYAAGKKFEIERLKRRIEVVRKAELTPRAAKNREVIECLLKHAEALIGGAEVLADIIEMNENRRKEGGE